MGMFSKYFDKKRPTHVQRVLFNKFTETMSVFLEDFNAFFTEYNIRSKLLFVVGNTPNEQTYLTRANVPFYQRGTVYIETGENKTLTALMKVNFERDGSVSIAEPGKVDGFLSGRAVNYTTKGEDPPKRWETGKIDDRHDWRELVDLIEQFVADWLVYFDEKSFIKNNTAQSISPTTSPRRGWIGGRRDDTHITPTTIYGSTLLGGSSSDLGSSTSHHGSSSIGSSPSCHIPTDHSSGGSFDGGSSMGGCDTGSM